MLIIFTKGNKKYIQHYNSTNIRHNYPYTTNSTVQNK